DDAGRAGEVLVRTVAACNEAAQAGVRAAVPASGPTGGDQLVVGDVELRAGGDGEVADLADAGGERVGQHLHDAGVDRKIAGANVVNRQCAGAVLRDVHRR